MSSACKPTDVSIRRAFTHAVLLAAPVAQS